MRRACRLVLLLATFAIVASAAPAAAHPPQLPAGCQFQQGITSCTTTTTTSVIAPVQFGQGTVGPTTDGSGAALYCAQQGATFYRLATIFVAVQITTTTTTVTARHGSPGSMGSELPTETTTDTVAQVFAGQVECF